MTETLDIIDEKDEVIATASREECHEKKLRHRGVQVFILNEEGDFFLQKRSSKKLWDQRQKKIHNEQTLLQHNLADPRIL